SRNACYDQGLAPNEFWLRFLSEKPPHEAEEMLAFAVPDLDPAKGLCCANVSYPRVQDLAKRWEVEAQYILGAAVAHEIGHLLLGPKAHSTPGIMRAHWDRAAARLTTTGEFLFTPQQAVRMRAEVKKRIVPVTLISPQFSPSPQPLPPHPRSSQ